MVYRSARNEESGAEFEVMVVVNVQFSVMEDVMCGLLQSCTRTPVLSVGSTETSGSQAPTYAA